MKKKFLSLALALLMVAGATINSLAFCKEEPGVGNIPDDLQENLEKEKYSYHNENIVDRNDVFELD